MRGSTKHAKVCGIDTVPSAEGSTSSGPDTDDNFSTANSLFVLVKYDDEDDE